MATGTYYSVIRYVPDPLRGEQVNVGVLALTPDGGTIAVRFDRAFDRARSLGRSADLGFLREFRSGLEALAAEQSGTQQLLSAPSSSLGKISVTLEGKPMLDLALVKRVSTSWANSIQFSEPRGSLESDPERLADDVFRHYVSPEAPVERTRARDRRWVVARAATALDAQVRLRGELSASVVRKNRGLEGAVEHHVFELVLEQEEVRHAAHAISFDIEDKDALTREVDSAAWLLDDTRKAQPTLPLALLATDTADSPEMERARHICAELNARLIPIAQLDNWARAAVQELALQRA